jgi:hypothetical protein
MINEILGSFLKSLMILVIMIVVFEPKVVGQWEAQRDIAYDAIWSEYVSDCDCTQLLE